VLAAAAESHVFHLTEHGESHLSSARPSKEGGSFDKSFIDHDIRDFLNEQENAPNSTLSVCDIIFLPELSFSVSADRSFLLSFA